MINRILLLVAFFPMVAIGQCWDSIPVTARVSKIKQFMTLNLVDGEFPNSSSVLHIDQKSGLLLPNDIRLCGDNIEFRNNLIKNINKVVLCNSNESCQWIDLNSKRISPKIMETLVYSEDSCFSTIYLNNYCTPQDIAKGSLVKRATDGRSPRIRAVTLDIRYIDENFPLLNKEKALKVTKLLLSNQKLTKEDKFIVAYFYYIQILKRPISSVDSVIKLRPRSRSEVLKYLGYEGI